MLRHHSCTTPSLNDCFCLKHYKLQNEYNCFIKASFLVVVITPEHVASCNNVQHFLWLVIFCSSNDISNVNNVCINKHSLGLMSVCVCVCACACARVCVC